MNYKYWLIEQRNNILILKIDRPDCLNALNSSTLLELKTILEKAQEEVDVKGIIITGAGDKVFISGGDIDEIKTLDPGSARILSSAGNDLMQFIEQFPKPILAAINGIAFGGGCELAMACHLRIASVNSTFALPEAKLGIVTGMGGLQRMLQLVGKSKTYQLALTGEPISAEEAAKIGLVNSVVSHNRLITKGMELLEKVVKQSPVSLGAIIRSVNAFYNEDDGFKVEMEEFVKCFEKDDFKEGVKAFKDKRKPDYQ